MMIPTILISQLLAPVPAPAPTAVQTQEASEVKQDDGQEIDLGWRGSVAVGASITDGNTDIQRASVTADGVNRRADDRTTLGFSWNYATENGVLTQRRTFGRGQYDYFLTDRSYALVDASAQSDTQAGLDLRTAVGTGYGYQFLENDTWNLGAEAGVAYINQDLAGAPRNDFVAARIAYDATWKASQDVDLEQHMRLYPSLEDSDDIFGQLDTRAKLTLTEAMFAQLQWILDYNNSPSPGRERADNLFLIGVGWSF